MNILPALEAIDTAFGDTTRGDAMTLHQAQLVDQGMARAITDEEFEDAGRIDTHTTWKDVPDAHLEACDAALSHLEPEGWRFYIPAYMRLSLKAAAGLVRVKWGFEGQTIFRFEYSEGNGLAGYKLARFETLTEPQYAAVKLFLETMQQNEAYEQEASLALKQYWALTPKERPKLIIMD